VLDNLRVVGPWFNQRRQVPETIVVQFVSAVDQRVAARHRALDKSFDARQVFGWIIGDTVV